MVSWGHTLTSAHLDLGTWVSETGGQGQVKGKAVEEDGAGEQQEVPVPSCLPRPCFFCLCSLSMPCCRPVTSWVDFLGGGAFLGWTPVSGEIPGLIRRQEHLPLRAYRNPSCPRETRFVGTIHNYQGQQGGHLETGLFRCLVSPSLVGLHLKEWP